ncbi:MAG: hypothetical protein OdinLCB4_000430 [Candidatus Odinarchaeum yellowstonii]|uniref:Uncharacterized protein n=1 Tax=Odinarchaeota yellowstonii (strain LCB_4) TaxID=1841599 RepID=A0AAF0IBI9_ODILC|nr:MAG: hypothetical protein OdinLCB4_000430 [Candidatus Odinarchaeum yellowstonii]
MSYNEGMDKGMVNLKIEDIEQKKPVSKELELHFKGVSVGVTYSFNIWLNEKCRSIYGDKYLYGDSFIDFNSGSFSSDKLEKKLEDILYWKEDKIEILRMISGSNWGIFWSGVTGGIDRIDRILFSETYLNNNPFIHFELQPIELMNPVTLKTYDTSSNEWRNSSNTVKGYIRRFLTIYRCGFISLTYFLILNSGKREWLAKIPHLTLKHDLTVDELIFILIKKLGNFKLRAGEKTNLDHQANVDFMKILERIYELDELNAKKIIRDLVDKTSINYYSLCIWDAECKCQEHHANAVDIIRNHPWEIYGLRGPDRQWMNRKAEYIVDSITDWFNPYSDIVFKPFPRVHIEVTYPLIRRKSLISMGPFSPPQRLWELRVVQEKVFRTFNKLLSEETSKLSKTLKVEELIETVKSVANIRRRIIGVLEDLYWISSSINHIPDRNYLNLAQITAGLNIMKNTLFEKINNLVEISRDETNITNLDVGSRMSLIRTYASVLSIFLATIITLASSLSNIYIWMLGPRPLTLTLTDQLAIILQILGLNAAFLIPIVLIVWRIFKKFK